MYLLSLRGIFFFDFKIKIISKRFRRISYITRNERFHKNIK